MNEAHVYMLQHRGGRPEVRFVADEEMRKHGGVEAFEANLSELPSGSIPSGQSSAVWAGMVGPVGQRSA